MIMNQYDLMLVRIYTQSDELRKMAPWMQLYETDVFGIHIQGSDTPWYVSVMGSVSTAPYPLKPQTFLFSIITDFWNNSVIYGRQIVFWK